MRASLSLMSRKSQSRMVASRCVAEIADPVIHGVAAGEADAVHLRAHVALQLRLDIAEQQVGRRAIRFGQLGLEIGEHVEVGPQRGAVVHIGGVDAGPEEGFPGDALQSFEIDVARGAAGRILLREIVADDGHDFDIGEVAGRQRDIGGGAAQHAIDFPVRRFHAIIRYGSDYDK